MEDINKEILEKKLDNYHYAETNLHTVGELMVTITLYEYRNLIESVATKKYDIDKANADKYTRESENRKLVEENASLRSELYELKKKLDSTTENADKQ